MLADAERVRLDLDLLVHARVARERRRVAHVEAAVAAHKDAVNRVLSGLMAGTGKTEFRA
jgi:hypothetical protein